MGLLDQVMGNMGSGGRAGQKPGLGSTVAAGVILALLVKGVRSYQQMHGQGAREGRSFDPRSMPPGQPQAQAQGQGGPLGGILGGGGLGGLLGGLGGAGALGALVSQFHQRGLGQQVQSWVGPGQNEPVAPDQVAHALGDDNVQALQQQTGMSRDQLLSELSHTLPEAMHELTPDGRLPDDSELGQIVQQATTKPG